MQIELLCTYCGYKVVKALYSKLSIEKEVCDKCGDSSLRVRDKASTDIDYYAGSPPFPEDSDPYDDLFYINNQGDQSE